MLGVTRSACSQWESAGGTAPRRERLEQLANLLGVSYEWLATGRKPKEDRTAIMVKEGIVPPYRAEMTDDRAELLKLYSALPVKMRKALLEFLRSL